MAQDLWGGIRVLQGFVDAALVAKELDLGAVMQLDRVDLSVAETMSIAYQVSSSKWTIDKRWMRPQH